MPLETTSYSLDDAPPSSGERREDKRHLTLFRVGAMQVGDQRELCLITNISSGGMKIRPYCSLAEGQALVIELKTGMSVPGTVAWIEDQNVGVQFDEPVDVLDILSTSQDGPRPRMPRVEVNCAGKIKDGVNTFRVHVHDVSQGGVKVQTASDIPLGVDLSVTLPGMEPQPAVARWSEDGFVGITFNRLLPLSFLVDWLRQRREELRAA